MKLIVLMAFMTALLIGGNYLFLKRYSAEAESRIVLRVEKAQKACEQNAEDARKWLSGELSNIRTDCVRGK